MNTAEIVPFGKYKGQPVEVLLADDGYRDWAMSQPWFKERYVNLYQTVVNYGGEPADSPEHNQMQATFLDDARCHRLDALVGRGNLYDRELCEPRLQSRKFEDRGWDVTFNFQGGANFHVELKPDLGDDFPNVLRQVLRYPTNRWASDGVRCVVVRRHSFQHVTWSQVVAMFAESGIKLVQESALDVPTALGELSLAPNE